MVQKGFNDLAAKAPDVAAQWHPTLNGNLTPEMVTPGSHRRVWWQCPLGHTWKAFVYSRTGAQRCGCAGTAGKSCTAVFAEDATGKLIPAGGAKIGETVYQTLEAAVTAAASGDTIQLGAGKYTLYKKDAVTTGKDLTFVGQGADETTWGIGATMPDPDKFGTEYNGDYSFDGAKTITFKDMTLQSAGADYLGFIRADQTVVEDCTINGKTFYWGYTSASFKNTTFNCPSGDYAIWTYSSPTMTFDTCTFNSSGKVINVYTDYGAGKQDITVNFENCTVNNTGKSLKPVLNINDSNMGKFKYILNISGNTTVTGVDVDKDTCSRLFGFGGKAASNNKGKTVVNFGDTTVWEDGKMVDAKAYHTDGVKVDGVTYGNGGSGANDILYAEGYKDNAFTITYSEWAKNPDGTQSREGTKTCKYCGQAVTFTETKEADPIDWDVSKSKIATKLDTNTWTSNVTLSLPSAEEALGSDIVFVLDKSSCKKETAASAAQMLTALQSQVQSNGSKIQVGVVVFGGDARVSYPLEAFPATEAALEELSTALSTRPDGLMGGSNMHAGLLAAQEMLRCSTTDANRKYVILVSDGLTRLFTGSDGKTKDIYYQYTYQDMTGDKQVGTEEGQISPKDCVYFGMIDEWTSVRTKETNTVLRPIPYGSWDTYFSKVKDWVRTDGDAYALNYETYGNDPTEKVKNKVTGEITDTDFKYIGHNDYENHAMSVDRAVYEAYDSFTGMVDSGYRCYAVLPDSGTPFGTAFMDALNEYAHNSVIDFAGIGAEILYAVGAGSTVEDKMGDAFDFVPGSLKLTVGGTELESKAEGNVTYFGDRAENLNEENFRFKVQYAPDTETFVWTINENVSNFAPVQLTYTVKLTNPETAPGTYGVEDLNGEKTLSEAEAEKALFTNAYAVLNAKNSAGAPVKVQEFPKPSVSYTVKSFIDASGSPAIIAAACLNTKDHYSYLIGYSDGTVRPNGRITRAEVATIFFRLLTDDARQRNWSSENNFSDVSADKWYNNAVSTLCHMGVLGGYSDGTFRPNAPITRAEFAKIAVSFSQANGSAVYSYFTDVKTTDWFAPYVTAAKDSSLIEGYSDGSFKPENRITRAEACTIVNRVLGRKPSKNHMKISGRIDWPDCTTADWFYEAIMEATNSHTYQMGKRVETWNGKLPQRDWAALENNWASAYTGKGGEVH